MTAQAALTEALADLNAALDAVDTATANARTAAAELRANGTAPQIDKATLERLAEASQSFRHASAHGF